MKWPNVYFFKCWFFQMLIFSNCWFFQTLLYILNLNIKRGSKAGRWGYLCALCTVHCALCRWHTWGSTKGLSGHTDQVLYGRTDWQTDRRTYRRTETRTHRSDLRYTWIRQDTWECELQVCSPLQGSIRPRWAAQFVQFFFSLQIGRNEMSLSHIWGRRSLALPWLKFIVWTQFN